MHGVDAYSFVLSDTGVEAGAVVVSVDVAAFSGGATAGVVAFCESLT